MEKRLVQRTLTLSVSKLPWVFQKKLVKKAFTAFIKSIERQQINISKISWTKIVLNLRYVNCLPDVAVCTLRRSKPLRCTHLFGRPYFALWKRKEHVHALAHMENTRHVQKLARAKVLLQVKKKLIF